MPEISIIVPVYRAEQHLSQCIESILSQTFEDFELILVDDGSPDKSGDICDEFSTKDIRVKVIHKENGGVSAARNAGLDVACGKYVMFCDSDDWVDEDWCKCLHEAIIIPNVVMAVCGFKEWEQGNYSIRVFGEPNGKIRLCNMFGVPISGAVWNKIYKVDQILKHNIRFLEGISYGEDARFTYLYLATFDGGCEVYFSSLTPNNYRIESSSLSRKYVKDFWNLEKELIELRVECARAHGVKTEDFTEEMNNFCFRLVFSSIRNIFCSKNDLTAYQKYNALKEIVHSKEFEQMKKCRAFASLPLRWRLLYKKGLFPLLYLCNLGRKKYN